jgi:hypothetical protein
MIPPKMEGYLKTNSEQVVWFCLNCVAYTTLFHSFIHAMPGEVEK